MRRQILLVRCGFVVFTLTLAAVLNSPLAHATIPYGGLAGGTPGSLGPGLPSPSVVPGKEYSHDIDHTTIGGGGVPDPEQVIAWDGSGGTADGLDYSGSRINYQNDDQVDAIANRGDHLFTRVIGTAAVPDQAHLIFSHDDQISVYFGGGPPVVGGPAQFSLSPLHSAGPFSVSGGVIGGTGEISYELAGAIRPRRRSACGPSSRKSTACPIHSTSTESKFGAPNRRSRPTPRSIRSTSTFSAAPACGVTTSPHPSAPLTFHMLRS